MRYLIRKASENEWEDIFQQCEYATYFQSKEWASIWEEYTRGVLSPNPQMITFADGKKALLPFSQRKSLGGLLKHYISSPGGTFGGWLSPDNLTKDHARTLTNILVTKFKKITLRVNPYNELLAYSFQNQGKEDVTHVLHLADGYDSIYKQWSKNKGSMIRKLNRAKRAGVIVRPAETWEHWHEYYSCYASSLKRWGNNATSRYTIELFEIMFKLKSSNIRLWLALHDAKVICGAMCFYARKHAVYWHGAALSESFSLRPVNLLMSEAIKKACDEGYRWFDFNPSGGHAGVQAFKESFKAEPRRCPLVELA